MRIEISRILHNSFTIAWGNSWSHDFSVNTDYWLIYIKRTLYNKHGLPSQNTPFRDTSNIPKSTQKLLQQIYLLWTTGKTEKEETSPDHSLDTANIIAPAVMTCIDAAPYHNDGTGTTASSRQTNLAIWGHNQRSHHDTPHQSHHKSSTHCSSSGYHSQDHTHNYLTNHWSIVYTKMDHAFQDHTPAREA